MNDPDRIREREHWQAIAEQLGLSAEPEEPSASEQKQAHPEPQHKRAGEQAASPIERAELLEEEPSPRRGRRGRGRGRQKKIDEVKTSPKAVKDEEQIDTPSAPDEEEETEAEDVRSLSNWNVPSWNELIASLYRPERDRG